MPLRYGILGTGSIATEMVEAIGTSELCEVAAVASRTSERAAEFAAAHGIGRHFGSYEELIASAGIDVVYVSTPHPQHERWAAAAVAAGLHVLCEKPLTLDRSAAERLIAAAEERGTLLLEAFAYRFHPQTEQLLRIVAEGGIGELRAISVCFSFDQPEGRQISRALGGGGILDVGCYCTSMAGQLVEAATSSPAPEPLEVMAMADLDPEERVDLTSAALMRYEGGVTARLSCGVGLTQDDHVRAYGSEGWVELDLPAWLAGHRADPTAVILHPAGGRERRFEQEGGALIFSREADGFARLLERPAEWPRWSATTLANMAALDAWRAAVGVRYNGEDDPSGGRAG